jgi:5'-nucleotidase/UDP-sugar diphosphatase
MVAYVDFSGAELLNYLNVAASKQAGSGAFAQFDGVNLRINDGEVTRAIVHGREIDPNGTYRLAVNAFMAAGGDGYPVLADHPNYVNTGFVDADVMVEFIQANSPLNIANFNPGLAVVRR